VTEDDPPIRRAGFVAPAKDEITFRIMRQGSRIGQHSVRFRRTGRQLAAATEVDIVVKLAGVTVFRLKHRFEEVWEAGRLTAATSRLLRNGEATDYRMEAQGDATLLRRAGDVQKLPADIAPLTWWDPSRFGGPLFHVYDGRPLQATWQGGELPRGGWRWQVSGTVSAIGTYRADRSWQDWQTRGEDGSRVTYVPT
jgi:hypothetical protein